MSDHSDLINRLQTSWIVEHMQQPNKTFIDAPSQVGKKAADALKAQAKRIEELEVPLCIGRRTIGIMAEEGCWTSENGRSVVAAGELFKQDPYARIAELEAALAPFSGDEIVSQEDWDRAKAALEKG